MKVQVLLAKVMIMIQVMTQIMIGTQIMTGIQVILIGIVIGNNGIGIYEDIIK